MTSTVYEMSNHCQQFHVLFITTNTIILKMVVYTGDILSSTISISYCPLENTPSHWPQWYTAHNLAPLVRNTRETKNAQRISQFLDFVSLVSQKHHGSET
jgi:hypothetical protein